MKINELIKEVHENAVAHGWWEDERPEYEIFALIHSELSEALEEARAGRPNVWHGEDGKPEGICVELIDAAIRMMDFLGKIGYTVKENKVEEYKSFYDKNFKEKSVAFHVCVLHSEVCNVQGAYRLDFCFDEEISYFFAHLFFTVNSLGEDPEALLIEKHEFNKTRPYKHGKLF